MDTFGNVWTISHNAKLLTPKGLVKNTAKQTGKALIINSKGPMSNDNMGNNDLEEPSTSYCNSDIEKRQFDDSNTKN